MSSSSPALATWLNWTTRFVSPEEKEISLIPPVSEENQEPAFIVTNLNEEEVKPIEDETLSITEFTFNTVNDEAEVPVNETPAAEKRIMESADREEQIKLAQERIRKLKDITLKMKSPEGLAALEKQTAFERKNIVLENKTPSAESSVSRYTLSEGDDKKIEIRPNNSFLHDNVD